MELDLMKRVFRAGDTEPFEVLPSGHAAWLLARVSWTVSQKWCMVAHTA